MAVLHLATEPTVFDIVGDIIGEFASVLALFTSPPLLWFVGLMIVGAVVGMVVGLLRRR